MPDYQFLSANMSGLTRMDSRFYIDLTLSLDGAGSYTLLSDSYVIEAGKRAEIGDPSGLGLVYRTQSEGIYTDNGDGSVTTSVPGHVAFEIKTDTYSEQMKDMMNLDLGGSNADGTYVFAFPAYSIEETGTWTFEGGKLTLTNPNEATAEAEGDPLKFHYVSAKSDQLTGDFTVKPDALSFE